MGHKMTRKGAGAPPPQTPSGDARGAQSSTPGNARPTVAFL